jgi:small subunit ribosomal protein S27Ae
MAAKTGGAGDKQGKKEHKNKPVSKKYSSYKIDGAKVTRKKSCVKCGQGVFMAVHKDRLHCGKCGYTEFLKR